MDECRVVGRHRMAAAIDGKDGLLGKLAAFGRCVENFSIYIVLAIDSTIHALEEVDQIARALTLSCESITHEISINPVLAGSLLDPTGEVVDDLSGGQRRIEDLLPGLIAQSSAQAQMDVTDQSQRDILNFAFERSIESFGWVVDAVTKLRQAILGHDLAREPKPDENGDAEAALGDSLQSNAA
jgi:hypothetical protein